MKGLVFILFTFITTNFGCYSPSGPIQDIDSDLLLQGVKITQIDYDTLSIQIKAELPSFPIKRVNKIFIGTLENNTEVISDTISLSLATDQNNNSIALDRTLAVSDDLVNVEVFVKFIFSDNNSTEYKENIDLLTFPYKNTKVYINWLDFIPHSDIQDFSLNNNVIYYHPLGPEGVYEYNRKSGVTRDLLDLIGGDFIDSNSKYIIVDDEHHALSRFNIAKDTVDLRKSLSSIVGINSANLDILGVAAADSLFHVVYGPGPYLATISDSLTLLSNISFGRNILYLKFYNNTLFGFDYYKNTIVRYDLNLKKFLSDKPLPTWYTYGFKIYSDTFYFSDYDKHIIGFLPLNDIINYDGSFPKNPLKKKD